MSFKYENSDFTQATSGELQARREIIQMVENKLPFDESFFRDLPLYLHAGILSRILAIEDIYKRIIDIPGIVLDLGTYKCATAVLCENLRAIHEPFNHQRIIFALDTFSGYLGFKEGESNASTVSEGSYATGEGYPHMLQRLISRHEIANKINIRRHRVVPGDAIKTLPDILESLHEPTIALSFFDMNAYSPTFSKLKEISPRLVPGSTLVFWQHSRPEISGERKALNAALDFLPRISLSVSKYYPSMVVATVE